jgi:hypothetical protein
MGTFSVLTDVTRHSAACRRPFIKQTAIERGSIRASQGTLLTKVLVGTVRLLILGSAVCTGIWLGIRPLEAKVRSALTLPDSHPVQIKQSPCSGIKVDAFQVPPGYALVNITTIGRTASHCSRHKIRRPRPRSAWAAELPTCSEEMGAWLCASLRLGGRMDVGSCSNTVACRSMTSGSPELSSALCSAVRRT